MTTLIIKLSECKKLSEVKDITSKVKLSARNFDTLNHFAKITRQRIKEVDFKVYEKN
jgi:hypothetical protein